MCHEFHCAGRRHDGGGGCGFRPVWRFHYVHCGQNDVGVDTPEGRCLRHNSLFVFRGGPGKELRGVLRVFWGNPQHHGARAVDVRHQPRSDVRQRFAGGAAMKIRLKVLGLMILVMFGINAFIPDPAGMLFGFTSAGAYCGMSCTSENWDQALQVMNLDILNAVSLLCFGMGALPLLVGVTFRHFQGRSQAVLAILGTGGFIATWIPFIV